MKRTEKDKFDLSKLTPIELQYWRHIYARNAPFYLKGRPGGGKSAIFRSIAKKLNLLLIDKRLPTCDELDLGVAPHKGMVGNIPVVESLVPDWAVSANLAKDDGFSGTLIVFEELNRSTKSVMDAALGILNEKVIGHKFTFSNHVYMAATGNLGEEDNCNVNELDLALKTRLATKYHESTLKNWKESYANDNVHELIVQYLTENPTEFYQNKKIDAEEVDTIANDRTWTNLSNFILSNFDESISIAELTEVMKTEAKSYIGISALKFVQWLQSSVTITLEDIFKGKANLKILAGRRDMQASLVTDLKAYDITTLTKVQVKNTQKFLKTLNEDVLGGYLMDVVVNMKMDEKGVLLPEFKEFYKNYISEYSEIMEELNRVNTEHFEKMGGIDED